MEKDFWKVIFVSFDGIKMFLIIDNNDNVNVVCNILKKI